MEEIYFDPNDTPEHREAERQREQREAELARKIRREVLRVQSGEAERDIELDRQAEQEQATTKEAQERLKRRRNASPLWQFVTGNILVNKGVARYYPQMIALAVMFFLSIAVIFYSLHMDVKYIRLEREVRLLRESSLRFQSLRFERSSHSAIMEQLRQRDIILEEASVPAILID